MVRPEDVDVRLAVGVPVGETPIKMTCPMHKERLGVEDDKASLAVYRSNLHCFGCGFHVARRYASLAFLLGAWDGRGREDSERVREAVRRIKPCLHLYTNANHPKQVQAVYVPPPPDPVTVEAFHQFLLTYKRDRMMDELVWKRGLSLDTIRRFRLGHTGTHFSIPVCNMGGGYLSLRYRADEKFMDADAPDFRKYEGTWGHNHPYLYPLSTLSGVRRVESLWVTEGEIDALSSIQAGETTLTITNGAGSLVRILDLIAQQLPGLHVNRWVIAVDQDAAGDQAASKLLSALSEANQSAVRARWGGGAKDLTEYYASGGKKRGIWWE